MPARANLPDPDEAWKPGLPKDWDRRRVGHLFRRAGFGAPPARPEQAIEEAIAEAVAAGAEACVERLLAGWPGQEEFDHLVDSLGDRIAAQGGPDYLRDDRTNQLQGWWLYRMVFTPHPLLEKCALFWHNHFATSIAKVRDGRLMLRQNRLLRKHALGTFPPLLLEMSYDPAMLVWLDSNSNLKGHPNENYAREIMELFSLGVGNYTEQDIREAARAFTGWSTSGGKYVFNEAQHDAGKKTVLGRTGNWNGDDVVRILLEQPAAARFLVRKMYRWFVSEGEAPPDEFLQPLVAAYRDSGYDMRAVLGVILRSRFFHSDQVYRARIKSPVEYVVGLVRFQTSRHTPYSYHSLAAAMDGLGQELFAPPNVAGWDGGAAWLNSATLLARHNLAAKMIYGNDAVTHQRSVASLPVGTTTFDDAQVEAYVERLLNLHLDGVVAGGPRRRRELMELAKARNAEANRDGGNSMRWAADVLHTIALMPEYQLA